MKQSTFTLRVFLASAMAWAAGSAIALVLTLRSLEDDAFDGLNNLLQLPFAFPWLFAVPASSDHVRNAWVAMLLGLLNATLLAGAGALIARAQGSRDRR
jgi:hypothetical protein